jgi:hypothetical protein
LRRLTLSLSDSCSGMFFSASQSGMGRTFNANSESL